MLFIVEENVYEHYVSEVQEKQKKLKKIPYTHRLHQITEDDLEKMFNIHCWCQMTEQQKLQRIVIGVE